MRTKLGPQLSGTDQGEGQNGDFPGFKVDRQLEAVCKHGLHHQTRLVFGGIARRSHTDRHVFFGDPRRLMGQQGFSLG
jgi:hypothetical protein